MEKPTYRRFPKVPIERRAYAFLIDFVSVWLVSTLAGIGALRWLIFIIAWLILRVVVPEKNQGQTLGRWSLDIKLIDARFNRIPDIVTLIKREAVVGGLALLAMIGLNIGLKNGISLLILISPLVADCGVALADEQLSQAYHDRLFDTIVIQTRRGFSLDLRLKKLLAQLRQNMRQ